MKRLLAAALLLALPLAAQDTGAAYKLDNVAVRLDGQAGGTASYSAIAAPSGCAAGYLAVFLGSPVRLNCDSGLTYDAATDTLTAVVVKTATVAAPVGSALGLSATAPAATTGASQVGVAATLTASAAVASTDTAGAAAGGSVTVTAGDAARNTSGNANGGDIVLNTGTGIGTGVKGLVKLFGGKLGISGNLADGYADFTDSTFAASTGQIRAAAFHTANRTVSVGSTGIGIRDTFSYSFGSAADGLTSQDTYISRGAAATVHLGQAASATPIAQTLGVQNGAGTNIAGQPRVYRGSLGTGSADPGALIDRTGYPGSTGTTVHTESSRRYVSGHWTALTAGAATGFATLTYAASTSIGAEFFVTIRAGDGTNRQGMSYRVAINSVRDAAGNTQSVVAVIGTPPVAAGSGTLTCTFDAAEGASAATLRANCASSLTETFLDANFQVIANGPGLTVGTL